MQTKRIAVFIISAIIGLAATLGVMWGLFNTTLAHFSLSNFALLSISVFSVVAIWLDYFLGTEILKS